MKSHTETRRTRENWGTGVLILEVSVGKRKIISVPLCEKIIISRRHREHGEMEARRGKS